VRLSSKIEEEISSQILWQVLVCC